MENVVLFMNLANVPWCAKKTAKMTKRSFLSLGTRCLSWQGSGLSKQWLGLKSP